MPYNVHTENPPTDDPSDGRSASAPSWVESLSDLVISRIELIQAEAKQAAADRAERVVMIAISAFAAVLTWLLSLAAVIGIIQHYTGFAWYWTCLVIAGIHLLAIAALLHTARAPKPPTFQHTRSEFQKDREWLKNLQHRKSKP